MSDYPPDNYGLYGAATPVWNTDCELDTTTFLSSDASIHMLGTSAKAMQWTKNLVPCAEGDVFSVDAVIRQDDITAGNTQQVHISWWHSDKTFHDWTTIFDDELPAVDTWYTISGSATAPATACYAAAVYVRAAVGFDAWLDTLGLKKIQPACLAYLSSDTSLTTGSVIPFDSETYDYGGIYDQANTQIVIPSPGIWLVQSGARLKGMSHPEFLTLGIYREPESGGGFTLLTYGNTTTAPKAGDWNALVSFPGLFNLKDKLKVYIFHDHGSALDVYGASTLQTWVSATKLTIG